MPERKSPLAPTSGGGVPQGIYRGPAPVQRGTLRRRGGPTGGGEGATAAHRRGTLERHGAAFRVQMNLPGPVPESAPTMANARIIKGYAKFGAQRPNFWGGTATG